MVVETEYYEALEISPQATELEIKKAYRRLAVKLHPDKNPGDEEANQKFQVIGEAYQVLSDPQLRAAYDKYGKEKAVPGGGFEDPAEFFSLIFGGEAFTDWIGEISLMKDMTKSMDITMREAEQEQAAADKTTPPAKTPGETTAPAPEAQTSTTSTTSAGPTETQTAPTTEADAANPYSQVRPKGIPIRPALMEKAEHEAYMNASSVTEEEKELRAKEKKRGGLTAEQREELRAYELERQRKHTERVDMLTRKLVDRISLWTETDKGADVTKAFQEKIKLEIENLKMESFGLEILHAIGAIYISKGTSMIKSHKGLFGISGFWSRLKDKGNMAKETWGTISSAIDAQYTMQDMAKAEEAGGEEWTDERRAEHEKLVMGKLLHAVWLGSKLEVQSVLREVCDRVLGDRAIKLDKRLERAEALVMVGGLLRSAQRDPDEEGDFLVFEQLMAEAQVRRDKKAERRKRKEDPKEKDHAHKSSHS